MKSEKDIYVEGNKLIAEFMGAINETGYFQASTIGKTKVPTGRMYMTERFPDNMHLCSESDLEYHSSWDWLMPVVEKIVSMGFRFEIDMLGRSGNDVHITKNEQSLHSTAHSKTIDAVRVACVQFIQWYNKNNSKP